LNEKKNNLFQEQLLKKCLINKEYTDELEKFFKTVYDEDINNVYSVDELYAKYYEGSLNSTYLYNALDSLSQKDIFHFIIDLVKEIEFLNNHFQKETLSESEKQQYELKLEEKNKQLRNKNNNIIKLNEEISNLESKIYKLKQNKRIIYKAASRVNQRHALVNEVSAVLQEEANEDQFKIVFDKIENELESRRLTHKNIINN